MADTQHSAYILCRLETLCIHFTIAAVLFDAQYKFIYFSTKKHAGPQTLFLLHVVESSCFI